MNATDVSHVSPALLEILRCRACGGAFAGGDAASIACAACGRRVAVARGIPRFVSEDRGADSFGLQWTRFRSTQLDSHSGQPISRARLYETTGWDWTRLKGARVLDAGCGAGRFAEIALQAGVRLAAVDASIAIDAAARNLSHHAGFQAVQASIFELPFAPRAFDALYCLGVLQHTPDPERAFHCLVEQLVPGGVIAVDVYPRHVKNLFRAKTWLRPLTTRLSPPRLMRLVDAGVPRLLPVSRRLAAIPGVGQSLRWAIPVANYEGVYDLSASQQREWAILDTFDMLAPEHDRPQSIDAVRRWCARAGLRDVEVFRRGQVIARGRAPA